jgi:hypothetical protein
MFIELCCATPRRWSRPVHMLAVGALTVVVSLILYPVAVLEYPFDGSLRVEPDAFELVLNRIEDIQ